MTRRIPSKASAKQSAVPPLPSMPLPPSSTGGGAAAAIAAFEARRKQMQRRTATSDSDSDSDSESSTSSSGSPSSDSSDSSDSFDSGTLDSSSSSSSCSDSSDSSSSSSSPSEEATISHRATPGTGTGTGTGTTDALVPPGQGTSRTKRRNQMRRLKQQLSRHATSNGSGNDSAWVDDRTPAYRIERTAVQPAPVRTAEMPPGAGALGIDDCAPRKRKRDATPDTPGWAFAISTAMRTTIPS